MAAFGIVEFVARLAVVEGEKAAAEVQGFELHDDGQRRGVQLAETTVFVEQLRHESGEGDKVDRIDPVVRSRPTAWSKASILSIQASQLPGKGLVQQRLLQRFQRGEFPQEVHSPKQLSGFC